MEHGVRFNMWHILAGVDWRPAALRWRFLLCVYRTIPEGNFGGRPHIMGEKCVGETTPS
jgi:hypothetical protein